MIYTALAICSALGAVVAVIASIIIGRLESKLENNLRDADRVIDLLVRGEVEQAREEALKLAGRNCIEAHNENRMGA